MISKSPTTTIAHICIAHIVQYLLHIHTCTVRYTQFSHRLHYNTVLALYCHAMLLLYFWVFTFFLPLPAKYKNKPITARSQAWPTQLDPIIKHTDCIPIMGQCMDQHHSSSWGYRHMHSYLSLCAYICVCIWWLALDRKTETGLRVSQSRMLCTCVVNAR
jgi:hypothetical protein